MKLSVVLLHMILAFGIGPFYVLQYLNSKGAWPLPSFNYEIHIQYVQTLSLNLILEGKVCVLLWRIHQINLWLSCWMFGGDQTS
jgi:hypothetical protein